MEIIPAEYKDTDDLSQVFIESMYNDPMYKYIFENREQNYFYFRYFWKAIIYYTFIFGNVIKSNDTSGVMCLLRPSKTDFSFFDLLKTRFGIPLSILKFPFNEMKITMDIFMKLGRYQNKIIAEPHWYLMSLGVKPEMQGKGIGKKMLGKMLDIVEYDKKPIYLETETEKNVSIYSKYGFEVIENICIEKYNLKYYLMLKSKF